MAFGAPHFDAFKPVLSLLVQASVAAVALSLIIAVAAAIWERRKFSETLAFVTPFGWLGTIAGLIAGSTKEAIVGALLTGMLTIVGAMLSYTFSKDSLAQWRVLLPFSVIVLSIGALAGLSIGQINRSKYENFERQYAAWLMQYEKVDVPAMAVRVRYRDCVKRISVADVQKCNDLLAK